MKKNTVPALSDDEFVELEDLLAGLPEDCGAMSSDEADGYLTGLLLSPEEILPERWMSTRTLSTGSNRFSLPAIRRLTIASPPGIRSTRSS